MIDRRGRRIGIACLELPAQGPARDFRRYGVAVIDASLDLAPLFIVIPRGHADEFELMARFVVSRDQLNRVQECLTALLGRHTVLTPTGIVVVEALLDRADGNLARMFHCVLTEVTGQLHMTINVGW